MLARGVVRRGPRRHGERRDREREPVRDRLEGLSLEAGVAGTTAPDAVDLDLSEGDGFLYVLGSSSGAITGFSVNASDGSVSGVGGVSGLAAGYAGLIAT